MKYDWLFDEAEHCGEEFKKVEDVQAYDYKSGSSVEMERELISDLGLNEKSIVADIGSGTGHFAFEAARACAKVYAVDVSPAMVQYMENRLRDSTLRNVTVVQSGILSYEHDSNPVDVVVTKNTLHHFPDFWKVTALGNIHSMLREGGLLYLKDLVFSFPPNKAPKYINNWIENAPDNPLEGWSKSELTRHVKEEYSTYTWILEGILDQVGFDIIERKITENKIFASYKCIKR